MTGRLTHWLSRPLGALAVVGTTMVGVLSVPALAQEDSDAPSVELLVRSVDATARTSVAATVMTSGTTPSGSDFTVELNDEPVTAVQPVRLNDTGAPVGIVWVIDTSRFMNSGGALDMVKRELIELFAAKPVNQQWALVAYTATARRVVGFTSDPADWQRGIDTLQPAKRNEAAMRDGVAIALDEFRLADVDGLVQQRNIVVIGAGGEDLSSFTYPSIRGDLLVDDTALIGLHVQTDVDGNGEVDAGAGEIARLADESAGSSQSVKVSTLEAAIASSVGVVDNQYVLQFSAPADARAIQVTARLGEASATAATRSGERADGPNARPDFYEPIVPAGPSFMQTGQGKLIGAGLLFAACMLFAVGIGLVFVRSDRLDKVLSAYDPYASVGDDESSGGTATFATNKIVQQAVDITSRLAERRGIVSWFEKSLEYADVPLRAGELIFFTVVGSLVLGGLAFVVLGGPIAALIATAVALLVPMFVLKFLIARRRSKFMAVLPDMLQLLAGSLKAGYSLMQGLEAVSKEVEEPVGREMRRICIEARLGRPLDEALNESAERMDVEDYSWAILAISIQREVGGNLAELLMTVAETMVQRERLRRDVKSLTAEGRMSAIVLCILPPGLLGAMKVINPEYIDILFTEFIGNVMLGVAVALMVGGWFWMQKTVKVDV
jgi:tight adherence protein B